MLESSSMATCTAFKSYLVPDNYGSVDGTGSYERTPIHVERALARARAGQRTDEVALKEKFPSFDLATNRNQAISLTDLTVKPYLTPSKLHARRQEEFAQKRLKAAKAAKARIDELKTDAQAEQQAVSLESEQDLLAFLDHCVFTRRPFITLLDNGNLRVLWKNKAGEQIGIQFRGGKQVQYVFFARRDGSEFMARVSGRDSLMCIRLQIEALNLLRLMTA